MRKNLNYRTRQAIINMVIKEWLKCKFELGMCRTHSKSAEVFNFIALMFNSYRSEVNIYGMDHAELEYKLPAAELQNHSP
jgi:hypothetical protein